VSPVARIFEPFLDRASYRRLAFLMSALVLAGVWLGVLVVVWTLTAVFAITPLVVPALIGVGLAVRACAIVEASLARRLLGAELQLPARRPARGFWAHARVVLTDPFVWRAQAYLLLRLTAGLAFAIGLLVAIAIGLFLLAAPTFYWSLPHGIGSDGYRVDTLGESLLLVPAGVLVLIASFHAIAPLAWRWRTLSSTLLGQAPAPPRARAPESPKAAPEGRRGENVRGLQIHAATFAGLNVFLTIVWALTSRGYFWPVWPLLAFGLALLIHAWVVWVQEHPGPLRERRLDEGFAIHAGVWVALLLFLTGVWAASAGGYFWPVWPLLVGVLAVGSHAAALLLGSGDRSALTERISTLESTRAGAVNVQDAELRRIERDLHDGAQARLVALGMSLGMAEQKLASDDAVAARELLAEARTGAGEALKELRDLARGIHPPVLADRGLDAAVRALAAVSPISVTVSVTIGERPKAPVESAAYFVVAEALANAGKHARATRVDVRIVNSRGELSVEIHDDGAGGADANGSGLDGLRRRVEALDGRLAVISPPGGPTTIRAELPCG
jgi:signal transduction histidine kinase